MGPLRRESAAVAATTGFNSGVQTPQLRAGNAQEGSGGFGRFVAFAEDCLQVIVKRPITQNGLSTVAKLKYRYTQICPFCSMISRCLQRLLLTLQPAVCHALWIPLVCGAKKGFSCCP